MPEWGLYLTRGDGRVFAGPYDEVDALLADCPGGAIVYHATRLTKHEARERAL